MPLHIKSLKLLWLIHNITSILWIVWRTGRHQQFALMVNQSWVKRNKNIHKVMSFIRDLPTHSLSKLDSTNRFLLFCHIKWSDYSETSRTQSYVAACITMVSLILVLFDCVLRLSTFVVQRLALNQNGDVGLNWATL